MCIHFEITVSLGKCIKYWYISKISNIRYNIYSYWCHLLVDGMILYVYNKRILHIYKEIWCQILMYGIKY